MKKGLNIHSSKILRSFFDGPMDVKVVNRMMNAAKIADALSAIDEGTTILNRSFGISDDVIQDWLSGTIDIPVVDMLELERLLNIKLDFNV